MKLRIRSWASAGTFTLGLVCGACANAQISGDAVKLGLLMDMTGNYSEVSGMGSVIAAQMAAEDFGGKVLGKPIQVQHADMLNKVDIATAKAREWFDKEGVDAIVDVNVSSAALAVSEIAKQKNRVAIFNVTGTSLLTNENCTATTIRYTYDFPLLARSTARAMLEKKDDTWFFVTGDFGVAHDVENAVAQDVKAAGGKVLGTARVPLNAMDYSSALTRALASKAKVVAFTMAGADTTNAIKQAGEFGMGRNGQRKAAMLTFINEIHSLGLEASQDMYLTSPFYWDMNAETRAWSRRFFERAKKMPNMTQAGIYSSTTHYLNAIKAAGTDEATKVVAKMKEMPVNDFFIKNGRIREDGVLLNDYHLFQVKKPAESKSPWDYYKHIATVPRAQIFPPLSESKCPLVAKKN